MARLSYKVFVSSRGNIFMAEIAEMLADAIGQTGREVEKCEFPLPKFERGVVNLVVAPHEYYTLLDGVPEDEIVRSASSSVTVGVEQPGTTWFEEGARYASYGVVALDINQQGATELRRRGVEAYHLRLGYHPPWDVWGGDPTSPRDLDVAFMGSLTKRRARFLSEAAGVLAQWNCDIRLFEVDGPTRSGSNHFLTGGAKSALLAKSRVLLNVHQGERDYFEWVRVIEAMSNGAVVVSETSQGFHPLVPPDHFIHSDLDSLPGRLDALLRDEELRIEIAHSSYEFLRKHLLLVDSMDHLLTALESRMSRESQRITMSRSSVPSSLRRPGCKRWLPPATGVTTLEEHQVSTVVKGERVARTIIKDMILAEIDESRAIEALISTVEHGSATYARVFDTKAYRRTNPDVSVILTHYNYASFLEDAISSVVASIGVTPEIVLVDDHSDSNNASAAREIVRKFDWFPIRLVMNGANQGPSATRNCGVSHARSDLVFLLDADNSVFPHGLFRLKEALEESDAAFSYGIVECFGKDPDIVSFLPWNLERLTAGNYIDAMSMIRKSVWDTMGGFDTQADRRGGWDDYEFWLHAAAEGYHGELVKSFIGRYRSHGSSWQSVVNLDTDQLFSYFRSKYPHLPWRGLTGEL